MPTPIQFQSRTKLLSLVVGLVFLTPVAAADGALEINHACASGPGCFPGDNPNYPVEITHPGSYVLTSNLIVPDENTDGIQVQGDDVSIDLAGFALIGPVTCDNSLNCTPVGTGVGIEGAAVETVSVSNGTIRGMGAFGLSLGFAAIVNRVRAIHNVETGISASIGSTIANSTAFRNGGNGFLVTGCSIRGSGSASNGRDGIGGTGSTIVNNVISQNGRQGISSSNSSIVNNTVIQSSLAACRT